MRERHRLSVVTQHVALTRLVQSGTVHPHHSGGQLMTRVDSTSQVPEQASVCLALWAMSTVLFAVAAAVHSGSDSVRRGIALGRPVSTR